MFSVLLQTFLEGLPVTCLCFPVFFFTLVGLENAFKMLVSLNTMKPTLFRACSLALLTREDTHSLSWGDRLEVGPEMASLPCSNCFNWVCFGVSTGVFIELMTTYFIT
jgi:hypothetical protein